MLVSELSGLLEFARSLFERKAELDKEYFEQFIQPSWEAFKRIHENYKSSFRKYLDYVGSDNYKVAKLIEMMRYDSIDTDDLRSELSNMIYHSPASSFIVGERYLEEFAVSIFDYFSVRESVNSDGTKNGEVKILARNHYSNAPRYIPMISLSRNGTDNREYAKGVLEKAIRDLQSEYDIAAFHYYELKKMLLT